MPDPSPWITVGELAHAFAPESNAPPVTDDLVGRTLRFALENGQLIEHRFQTGDRLTWEILGETGTRPSSVESYFAAKVRDGMYLVDYVKHQEPATAVTLVVDLDRQILTALVGRLPGPAETGLTLMERIAAGKELTAVEVDFLSGAVNAPFTADTPRHVTTADLVGRRVEYTYSSTERYEHIYLSERFYTWHCLLGSEQGLADTDRCHCYKLAEDLYLFVWREKIVPTLGVVVVDFVAMRTTGKIFGYSGGPGDEVASFRVGAHARLLNVTERD
jgi:MoaF C-terminal domain/MoaF N-terminal domain